MKTTVAHFKKYKGDNGVLCDRKTTWGNPFKPKDDSDEERARVCRKFHRWWYLSDQRRLRKRALKELKNKVLLCWCAPKPCHCLTIATYVNWRHEHTP